jgi:hypothetical protein
MFKAIIASVRFANPFTTSHCEARKQIEQQKSMIERIKSGILAVGFTEYHKSRIVESKSNDIARQESILAKPNRILFPVFFSFRIGKNDFAVSLAGLRCNFPYLAMRYGTECDYAGNARFYRNWLGCHWDL